MQETVIATARRESDSDLSRAGSVLGTPSYMAPEQARGEVEAVDERADVFALGSILCEVLTGRPAFTGRTSGEIQRKAARGDLADASARLAGCGADGELVALARDCLAPEPDDRPRDAGAVAGRLTAYLAGVQERLHAAELAHAAEAARAEEAVRTAEAAEARSLAERRARRLTAALAAAVIGLIVLGGGGAAWLQRQHAARSAATARVVHEALGEAMRLEGEARAAAADDPARWAAALAEARRADGLLRQGEADPALGARVAAVLSSLKRRHDEAVVRAERTRVDRELLAALDRARSSNHVGDSLGATDRQYAAAFRAAGLDVDRSEAAEVGAWVAGRSAPVEIAAYLDDWTHVRRYAGAADGRRPWTHLNAAARAADPDPWRDTLRAGLADDATALRALADDEQGLKGRSVMSLNLLAMYLQDFAGDPHRAERVLRLSWKQSPDDYWTNFLIAEALDRKKPASSESLAEWHHERVRFLTAAIAARPESASAFTRLGDALREAGRLEEAIDAYREEVRRNPVDTRALAQMTRLLGAGGEGDRGPRQAPRRRPSGCRVGRVFRPRPRADRPRGVRGDHHRVPRGGPTRREAHRRGHLPPGRGVPQDGQVRGGDQLVPPRRRTGPRRGATRPRATGGERSSISRSARRSSPPVCRGSSRGRIAPRTLTRSSRSSVSAATAASMSPARGSGRRPSRPTHVSPTIRRP